MKIGTKLTLANAILASIAILVAGVLALLTSAVAKSFEGLSEHSLEATRGLEQIRFAGLRIVSSTNEHQLIVWARGPHGRGEEGNSGDRQERDEVSLIHDGIDRLDAAVMEYRTLVEAHFPGEVQFARDIDAASTELIEQSRALLESTNGAEFQTEILERKEGFETAEQRFLTIVGVALEREREDFEAGKKRVHHTIDAVVFGIWVSSIGSALFIMFFGASVTRRITRPVRTIARATRELSKGNLDVRIDVGIEEMSRDELGELGVAFNLMTDELRRNISEREQVRSELEAANEDLEQRIHERTADIRRNQEELIRAKERAEVASEAKSVFLSTMSHEIRTPLNGVLGMAELLQTTALDTVQSRYCAAISASASALRDLLGDILDLAKIEAGKAEICLVDFDVHALAAELAGTYRDLAAAGGNDFSLEMEVPTPGWFTGDRTRLRQVLYNLLGNAVKFTHGGKIVMCVRVIAPKVDGGDTWLDFRVRDTGIGMTAEALENLFQPFTQADSSTMRRYGGSGLGLAIVRRLVELMKGTIHVESAVGEGTEVRFELPLRSARAPAPDPTVAPVRPERIAARVLAAEDNPVNRIMLEAMLSQVGATATMVENGALAVASMALERFDLVFMDCNMPVMDGYLATAAIRASESGERRTPIIALTANAFIEDRDRCLAAGMDDYLAKPLTRENLRRVIDKWLVPTPKSSPASLRGPGRK